MQIQLERAETAVGLKNKKVLEVGGCVLPEYLKQYSPLEWRSIDISDNRLGLLKDHEIPDYYHFHNMSATDIAFEDNSFDRIFSINCFEHIQGMEKAYSEMYRVLKPGGTLFTIFGPIWSAPIGHHTWIQDGDHLIHYNDNIFPHWHHLAYEKSELLPKLREKYSADAADRVVEYIYDSDDLNRLTDGDHMEALEKSDFTTIVSFPRKRHYQLDRTTESKIRERWPTVRDPRTTEIMLILSKGPVPFLRKQVVKVNLAKQLLKEKLKR